MIKGHFYTKRKKYFNLFNTNKINFELPESWDEVKIKNLFELNDDSDYLDMFCVLTGVDKEVVRKAPKEEVAWIIDQISDKLDPSLLEGITCDFDGFEFDGVTYYLPEDLGTESVGQWWDIKRFEQTMEPKDFIPLMIATMCRPKGEEYDYMKASARAEMFKELDVVTAFKIRNFFLSSQLVYLHDMANSLTKTSRVKRLLRVLIDLIKNGVVYLLFIPFLKIKRFLKGFTVKKK